MGVYMAAVSVCARSASAVVLHSTVLCSSRFYYAC